MPAYISTVLVPIVCKTESLVWWFAVTLLFQCCASALVSVRIRIRIQLFISMRIRIQGAQLMLIRILVRLYIHKKLNTVPEHN